MNIKKMAERAKRELEQEKRQTYGIYVNKKAMKKACEKEKLKPKELITKIFTRCLDEPSISQGKFKVEIEGTDFKRIKKEA